jgi:hypothetical protein
LQATYTAEGQVSIVNVATKNMVSIVIIFKQRMRLTARVFPDPVCAIPTMSRPLKAIGQPWACIAVGSAKPCFLQYI